MKVKFDYTRVKVYCDDGIKNILIPDIKTRKEINNIFKENVMTGFKILEVEKFKNSFVEINDGNAYTIYDILSTKKTSDESILL